MNDGANETRRAVGRVADWTKENVELLRSMWLDGKSASQIAEAIGNGCTRNACIGRINRMGLTRCRYNPETDAVPVVLTEHEPEPEEQPSLYEMFGPFGVTIMGLKPTSCRFIAGDPVDAIYCGIPATDDSSWCLEHRELCGGRRYSKRIANANYKQRAKALAAIITRG